MQQQQYEQPGRRGGGAAAAAGEEIDGDADRQRKLAMARQVFKPKDAVMMGVYGAYVLWFVYLCLYAAVPFHCAAPKEHTCGSECGTRIAHFAAMCLHFLDALAVMSTSKVARDGVWNDAAGRDRPDLHIVGNAWNALPYVVSVIVFIATVYLWREFSIAHALTQYVLTAVFTFAVALVVRNAEDAAKLA